MEEDKGNQPELNPSAIGVYELPGEPAIVINGVPDIVSNCSIVPSSSNASDTVETHGHFGSNASDTVETHGHFGLGEWFEGREVRKWFMGRYYSGTVTEFDKDTGWYRVLYEDGDSEDLDWKELEKVLLPLDVTIPLKILAQRIVKKSKQPVHNSGKNVARTQNPKIKRSRTKGK